MAQNGRPRGGKLPYKLPPSCDPLFTSNAPPLSNQLAEIAESVRIAQTLKIKLDLQITKTRMELLRLEREETHAARHIARCKYPLALIRRVPNEILSHIFMCFADGIEDAPGSRGRLCTNVREGVWLLGHVCGHWRAVALSTPALWASFIYRCGGQVGNPNALAEEFLLRSGNYPLSVEFDCLGGRTHEHSTHPHLGDVCRDVFDAVLTRSPQWRAARFNIPPPLYPEMGIIRDNLPNLAKFQLSLFTFGEYHSFHDVETFRSCPRLVELNLQSFSVREFSPQYIAFPWHQLTRYSGAAAYGAVSVLEQAPNIVDCTLRYDHTDRPLPRRLVHQMRSLRLWGGLVPEFLDNLELPALERVSFRDNISVPMANLLRRSSPQLRSIELCGFGSTDAGASSVCIVDVLAAAPTVVSLEILGQQREQNFEGAAEVFNKLVYAPGQLIPAILPRLKHLTMTHVAFDDAFVRMIESRCVPTVSGVAVPQGSRLESLSVTAMGDTDTDHLLRLRQIEMQLGLRLSIQVEKPAPKRRRPSFHLY